MKKVKSFFPWCFPCNFFMFLSFFLTVKFVFIFLFNSFYEPDFIFNLTPFYLLSGLNNLQLLFLSYIVVVFDLFLHLNPTHRNIRISFLPTLLLIIGTGLKLTSNETGLTFLPYLILFLCSLFVAVIDNRYILTFEDMEYTSEKTPIKEKSTLEKPIYINSPNISMQPIKSLFASFKDINIKKKITEYKPKLSKTTFRPKTTETYNEWKEVETTDLSVQDEYFDEITDWKNEDELFLTFDEEIKDVSDIIKEKLDNLDEKIGEFEDRKKPEKEIKEHIKKETKIGPSLKTEYKKPEEILEEIKDSAFIMKDGILKVSNNLFKNIFGYKKEDISNKNLIDIISPDGLSGLEDYYFSKLRHDPVSSFETIILTKNDKKVNVKVKIKPVFINGEKVDIAIIKI